MSKLPLPLAAFHFLDGEGDPEGECERASALIEETSIGVGFVGMGKTGILLSMIRRPISRRTPLFASRFGRRLPATTIWRFPDYRPFRKSHFHVRPSNHEEWAIVCTVRDGSKARRSKTQPKDPLRRRCRPPFCKSIPIVISFLAWQPPPVVKPFDLQVNGYAGTDFFSSSLNSEQLHHACQLWRTMGGWHPRNLDYGRLASLVAKLSNRFASMRRTSWRTGDCRLSSRGTVSQPCPWLCRGASASACVPLASRCSSSSRCRRGTHETALAPEQDPGAAVTKFLVEQGVVVSAGIAIHPLIN